MKGHCGGEGWAVRSTWEGGHYLSAVSFHRAPPPAPERSGRGRLRVRWLPDLRPPLPGAGDREWAVVRT